MTTNTTDVNVPVEETVTVVVSDHANGGGANIQITVPKGTLLKQVAEQAGLTLKEGQQLNFKGEARAEDYVVNERGLATVTANTKAA